MDNKNIASNNVLNEEKLNNIKISPDIFNGSNNNQKEINEN